MFPDNISQTIDILVVMNVWKNYFGFQSNRKTQGQKHWVDNLYFKYQVCQMKLRHLSLGCYSTNSTVPRDLPSYGQTLLWSRLAWDKKTCLSSLELHVLHALLPVLEKVGLHRVKFLKKWASHFLSGTIYFVLSTCPHPLNSWYSIFISRLPHPP